MLDNIRQENGTVTHTVKGNVYTFKLLAATNAFSIAQYLIEIAAPVIGSLFDSTQDSEFNEGFGDSDASFGLELGLLISKQLNSVDIQKLAPVLLDGLQKDGVNFEIDNLRGSHGLTVLMSLLEVSLKENVMDFLVEWLAEKGLKIPSLEQIQNSSVLSQPE